MLLQAMALIEPCTSRHVHWQAEWTYPNQDNLTWMVMLDLHEVWVERRFARPSPWRQLDPQRVGKIKLIQQPLGIGFVHALQQLFPEGLGLLIRYTDTISLSSAHPECVHCKLQSECC